MVVEERWIDFLSIGTHPKTKQTWGEQGTYIQREGDANDNTMTIREDKTYKNETHKGWGTGGLCWSETGTVTVYTTSTFNVSTILTET